MKPLNKKERTLAFFKFLALFLIGILIVLIPFYFIIRLPSMEQGIKSEDIQKLEELLKVQKEYYAVQIDKLKNLFVKYDAPGEDIDKLNADIGYILSDMEHTIGTDTAWRATMYKNIMQTYLDLKKTKTDLGECKKELVKCGKELKEAKEAGEKPKDSLDPE
jgi:hypothetical protein